VRPGAGDSKCTATILLRQQTADGAAGSNQEDSDFSSLIDVNGKFARKPPITLGHTDSEQQLGRGGRPTGGQKNRKGELQD
jgi:hypothetical protein